MTQVGGCHCGNIRYEVAGDPKIKVNGLFREAREI
jgi:hypothetical protein